MSAAGSNNRAGAPSISIGDTSAPTDASAFTFEPGEIYPIDYDDNDIYRSAWWYIDPATDGWIKLDTELSGDGNDTVIAVYADVSGLVEVAQDDDSGSVYRTSLLDFYGYADFTYYVQVTNYDDTGTDPYVLRCSASTRTDTPPPPPDPAAPPPANDDRANAIELSVGETSTVNATNATMESGEKYPPGYKDQLQRSAWWYIDPTADGWVRFDTEQSPIYDNDTVLTVWAEVEPGLLVFVGYDDDSGTEGDGYLSILDAYLYADTRYYIQVTTWDKRGPLTYALRAGTSTVTDPPPPHPGPPPPPPPNDNFANAIPIGFGGTSDPTSSGGATAEPDEPYVSYYYTENPRTAWWKFTPTHDGFAAFDLLSSETTGSGSDLSTYIYVYTGGSLDSLDYVTSGYGSPAKTEDFPVTAGTTYYIQVWSTDYALDMSYVLHCAERIYSYSDWVDSPTTQQVFSGDQNPPGEWTVPATEMIYWSGHSGWQIQTFDGRHQVERCFQGQYPGESMSAIDCSWVHSRRYVAPGLFTWWTSSGTGEVWTPPGTCPPLWPSQSESGRGYTDHPIGIAFDSSRITGFIAGGYQHVEFRVFANAFWINLHSIQSILGPTGAGYGIPLSSAPWLPTLTEGQEIEWEDTTSTVSALDIQPTELVNQPHLGPTGQVLVDWTYSAYCVNGSVSPHIARFGGYGDTAWGPRGGDISSYGTDWVGAPAGPESFETQTVTDAYGPTRTREIPLVSGWNGEVIGWHPVDATTLEKAWDLEEEVMRQHAEADLGNYDETDSDLYYHDGGIRCVGIPVKAKSDTMPEDFSAAYGFINREGNYAYRAYSGIAFRATIAPPRYRIRSAGEAGARIDVLMQNESIQRTGDAPSPGLRAAGRMTLEAGMTEQEITVPASWLARYAEDGTKISGAGVSQGQLDRDKAGEPALHGHGNERSLIGFDLSVIPEGAVVGQVRLTTTWDSWLYSSGYGSLVLGWHSLHTKPATWDVGEGAVGVADYDIRDPEIDLALGWVTGEFIGRFAGLVVGPGHNDGGLYAGSTSVDPGQWALVIRYATQEESE